jgi:transposase
MVQRGRIGKWAFGQLRQFIDYKAQLNGVPLAIVAPKNTSKQGSCCGHIDRARRKPALFALHVGTPRTPI